MFDILLTERILLIEIILLIERFLSIERILVIEKILTFPDGWVGGQLLIIKLISAQLSFAAAGTWLSLAIDIGME